MDKYLFGATYALPTSSETVPVATALQYRFVCVSDALDPDAVNDWIEVDLTTESPDVPLQPEGFTELGTVQSAWKIVYELTDGTITSTGSTDPFVIQLEEVLVKGLNSFQNIYKARVTADEVHDVEHFKMADDSEQISAMITAYEALGAMVYADNNGDHYGVGDYDEAELDSELDPAFLRALQRAQVLEANELLDINSIHRKRLDGLMSETIGESSMMFRPGNISNFELSRRSQFALRNYLVIRARIGRAS